jgi:hypothetical protein
MVTDEMMLPFDTPEAQIALQRSIAAGSCNFPMQKDMPDPEHWQLDLQLTFTQPETNFWHNVWRPRRHDLTAESDSDFSIDLSVPLFYDTEDDQMSLDSRPSSSLSNHYGMSVPPTISRHTSMSTTDYGMSIFTPVPSGQSGSVSREASDGLSLLSGPPDYRTASIVGSGSVHSNFNFESDGFGSGLMKLGTSDLSLSSLPHGGAYK